MVPVVGVLLLVVIVGMVLVVRALGRDDRAARAVADADVIGRFGRLKLTRTELIDGNGRRYPLAGMTARVEDAEHIRGLYLMIEGPAVHVLESASIKKGNGYAARYFAQQINLAGRQQQP